MAITNPVSELEDENGNILGIAAKGLDTPVQISLTGNVTGNSGNTDLSGNVSIPATIADGAVSESKIATDAVTNSKVKDGAITYGKLDSSATSGSIAEGSPDKLATKVQVKNYVETVLKGKGTFLGVQTVATINSWTLANLNNGDYVIVSGSGTVIIDGHSLAVTDGMDLILWKYTESGVEHGEWQDSESNVKHKQTAYDSDAQSGSQKGGVRRTLIRIQQNANGDITPTFSDIPSATTSQTGIVQLKGSIAASESDDSKAATPKAVRDAINALDVAEVGGTGKYIKAVSEADGKTIATEETMDTTPTEGSQKAVTSGGVKAAIDAIDPGNTGMGEVVAAALNDLDARVRANEEAVSETNLGDRTADRLDVQELLVGGEDVAAKLDGKVDKVEGKGLSTNDFTDAYKDDVNANTSARHSHTNKTLLDNISQSDIDNWNSKQAALSFMTDAEVDALFTAAWNAANA